MISIDHTQPPSAKAPLILHEAIFPYVLLVTALSIPTHRHVVNAVFLPLLWHSYYHLAQTTSQSPPAAFVIGAFVVFHAYYSFDLLVLRNPRTEFNRTNSYITPTITPTIKSQTEDHEPYPLDSVTRRIAWTFDLVCSMRGIGWNWTIRPIPPIPADEATSLALFLRRRLVRLLYIWMWLDATMFWAHYLDAPYFLPEGNAYSDPSTPREPVYASLFARSSKPQEFPVPKGFPEIPGGVVGAAYGLLLHVFRTVLQGALIYTGMNGVYTEFAILFAVAGGLVGLGKPGGWRRRWLDWRSWPDIFGGWRQGDWGHGLTGWWGKAWHGLFKHVFTSPSRYVMHTFGISSGSPIAIALGLFTPFIMSATLHFIGSYTKSSDGWGGARFFLMQPLGIIIEQAFLYVYRKVMPAISERRKDERSATRKTLEWWAPYLWALGWCVLTSKPFFEDLRYGGVWAMQPVPVSIWKGLWSVREGWWPWTKNTDMGRRGWWEWDSSLGGWGIRL